MCVLQAVAEDSSRLDCIQVFDDKDPVKLTCSSVKGILTPDILLYQVHRIKLFLLFMQNNAIQCYPPLTAIIIGLCLSPF